MTELSGCRKLFYFCDQSFAFDLVHEADVHLEGDGCVGCVAGDGKGYIGEGKDDASVDATVCVFVMVLNLKLTAGGADVCMNQFDAKALGEFIVRENIFHDG